MSMLDRIRDGFKYLDKNGLKHLIEKIKLHDVHWTGTHAEYESVKDTIPAYAILHFTDDYEDGYQALEQVEKLPDADKNNGRVVQYVGATGELTKGHIFESDGTDWSEVKFSSDLMPITAYNLPLLTSLTSKLTPVSSPTTTGSGSSNTIYTNDSLFPISSPVAPALSSKGITIGGGGGGRSIAAGTNGVIAQVLIGKSIFLSNGYTEEQFNKIFNAAATYKENLFTPTVVTVNSCPIFLFPGYCSGVSGGAQGMSEDTVVLTMSVYYLAAYSGGGGVTFVLPYSGGALV